MSVLGKWTCKAVLVGFSCARWRQVEWMFPREIPCCFQQEWVGKNLEARMAKEGPAEVFTGEEAGSDRVANIGLYSRVNQTECGDSRVNGVWGFHVCGRPHEGH